MASQLTQEQVEEFTAAFKAFDRDNDNNINSADLVATLKSLGITLTSNEVTAWLNEADSTGKGVVSFTAFMALAGRNFRDIIAEEEMKEAFKIFDKNGDGFITNDELKATLAAQGDNLSDEEVSEIIKEMDVDGDGKLNYEEFAKMMTPPKH
ncbi:calmodulin 2-like protein [Obelidium mucronatum]|nr:calmodulin 2-like protein [Obelidium mucronatum]